jgi:hypothetical protein
MTISSERLAEIKSIPDDQIDFSDIPDMSEIMDEFVIKYPWQPIAELDIYDLRTVEITDGTERVEEALFDYAAKEWLYDSFYRQEEMKSAYVDFIPTHFRELL